ncbi:hypothetical protein EBR21_17530, partial [bacterium]|nr:hypothetical protein [bacterium]
KVWTTSENAPTIEDSEMHFQKTTSFLFAFLMTSTAVMGCRASGSKIRSTGTGPLPEQTQLDLAKVQILESSSDVASIEFSSGEEIQKGLTAHFCADASNKASQIVGLLARKSKEPVATRALLLNGQHVECTTVSRKNALLGLLPTNDWKADCNGRTIRFQLSRETSNASDLASHQLDLSLRQGASLVLVDVENPRNLIEVTLRGNTVSLAENNVNPNHPSRVSFSKDEISAFLQSRGTLVFPCTNTKCATSSSPLTLMRKDNGELLGWRSSTTQQGFSTAATKQTFRRSGAEGLRITSYNVENFWDDVPDNSKPYDDFSPELSNWYSEGFAEKKAKRIRDALLAAGLPDAVGLQEIESAANAGRSLESLK